MRVEVIMEHGTNRVGRARWLNWPRRILWRLVAPFFYATVSEMSHDLSELRRELASLQERETRQHADLSEWLRELNDWLRVVSDQEAHAATMQHVVGDVVASHMKSHKKEMKGLANDLIAIRNRLASIEASTSERNGSLRGQEALPTVIVPGRLTGR